MLLGYLPSTALLNKWQVFNGDMAFASNGDLYISTVGYQYINGSGRYANARLFKILAANIPTVAGGGALTTQFLADYVALDSSAVDGIAFDAVGAMYMTTKKFNGIQNVAGTTFSNQLYKSTVAGTATLMPAFNRPIAGYAIADLASCNFPLVTLASNLLDVYGRYAAGYTNLNWSVNNNTNVDHYEVQRSDDGSDFSFTTIANITPSSPDQAVVSYKYSDPQSGYGNPKYYRVREVTSGGMGIYSSVITVIFDSKISLLGKASPNPVADYVKVNVLLKTAMGVTARLIDQSGRSVYQHSFSGVEGQNQLELDGLRHLTAGLYVLEMNAGEETVRQKLVKQ
jgi:hypothetical protein